MKFFIIALMATGLILGCARKQKHTTADKVAESEDTRSEPGGRGPAILGSPAMDDDVAPEPEATGYQDDSSEDAQE